MIDGVKIARTVGRTSVVAEVYVVVLREFCADVAENGEAAVARIKYTNGGWSFF